ncbi:hypothetical protein BU161_09135 [Corynebacterium diphtheriae]|nr:hypothetical protein BU161_09135 [Corynebacterium diphtheriae]
MWRMSRGPFFAAITTGYITCYQLLLSPKLKTCSRGLVCLTYGSVGLGQTSDAKKECGNYDHEIPLHIQPRLLPGRLAALR